MDTPEIEPTAEPMKQHGSWSASDPVLSRLAREEPLTWWNPAAVDSARGLAASGVGPALVDDAAARLERFRPWIAATFPETASAQGLIESPLHDAREWQRANDIRAGRVLLKRDDILPVSGSIKARGGVHEVLQYAEMLAVRHELLPDPPRSGPDYAVFGTEPFRRLMREHRVVVGSTGNLGLSIGIIAAALELRATVHMSVHAQQWKKDLLRSRGVEVVEHRTEYTEAVAAGRVAAEADESVHFVDDEHSLSLFAGYAVAGARVARQLHDLGIAVDTEHPLFVSLPCGIGGAPGGVAYGLKREFGDAVHCVFVEPTRAPCMLLGVYTGRHDGISVAELGLDTRTVADGLAVGRASGFVGRAMEGLLAGYVTCTDEAMLSQVKSLHDAEGMVVEPSAAAALDALTRVARAGVGGDSREIPTGATHLAWLTGGGMLPDHVKAGYLTGRSEGRPSESGRTNH